jgi:hypothetical protein
MRGKTVVLMIVAFMMALSTFIFFNCGGSSSDDDDDNDDADDDDGDDDGGGDDDTNVDDDADDDTVPCNVEIDSPTSISGWLDASDCSWLEVAMTGDTYAVNPAKTVYQIEGQFVNQSDKTYYLRGKGDVAGQVCYAEIAGTGTYTLTVEYSECTTDMYLDMIQSISEQVLGVCTVHIIVDPSCPSDDDTDVPDDDTADDTGDDTV